MTMLSHVISKSAAKPRRLGVYGGSGLGKTTFAAQFPDAIVIDIEGGCDDIEVSKTPRCTRLQSVLGFLMELSAPNAEHGFKTVVLDSMDWLEGLILKDMHDRDFRTDYGKGAIEEARLFTQVLDLLEACRQQGMNVVMLAHSAQRNISDTNGNEFTRTEPKLSKRNTALWVEFCDELGLAKQKVFFSEAKTGFNSNKKVARTTGDVELTFAPSPQYAAKKRLPGLPDSVDLWSYGEYSQYVPYLQGNKPPENNLGGTV